MNIQINGSKVIVNGQDSGIRVIRRDGFGIVGYETPSGRIREDDKRAAGSYPALVRFLDVSYEDA